MLKEEWKEEVIAFMIINIEVVLTVKQDNFTIYVIEYQIKQLDELRDETIRLKIKDKGIDKESLKR